MMKRLLFAALGGMFMLPVAAEVCYLRPPADAVPRGRIAAVEARVASPQGRVGSETAARWALCWPGAEVGLRFDFRTHLDGVDEPEVVVECNGRRAVATSGFNVSGGWNTVAVEWGGDGAATVLAGEFALRPLLRLDSLPRPTDSIRVEGDRPRVEMLIVETDDADFGRLHSGYGADALEAAERWRYLDRENDPAFARPGGDYELALIADSQGGYDIIYMGGAVTNAAHWEPGMLKGRIEPTGFAGYYKLEWVDATGRLIPDECFAEFDSGRTVLTLSFPSLQASLRFSLRKSGL